MMQKLLALLPLLVTAGGADAKCGPNPDMCETDMGAYHISLPESGGKDAPVLVFLHGYGGNGKGTMGNRRLVTPMMNRGWAVIAPDGLRRDGDGPKSWNFFPGRTGRDETAFLKEVVADAAARFGTSVQNVMLSGFSAGGFMVSYLACEAPETFAAYAPVSGGFWRPHPQTCAGPVKLLHTHGWRDTTVPIEGRKLRGGMYQQGDIFAGLEIWRAANGCSDEKPSKFSETGEFWRRSWSDCSTDSALELAMWPGGHTLPGGWSDMAIDWFESVTGQQ